MNTYNSAPCASLTMSAVLLLDGSMAAGAVGFFCMSCFRAGMIELLGWCRFPLR